MEPIKTGLPEDLNELSDEELESQRIELAERAEQLASGESIGDAELDEIESLAADVERLETESDRRVTAAAERQERLENAMARLRPVEDVDEVDEGDGEPDEDEGDGEPKEEEEEEEASAQVEKAQPIAAAASKPARVPTRRPRVAKPKERPRDFMRATNHALKRQPGEVFASTMDVAKAIAETKAGWSRAGNISPGQSDYISIASGVKDGFEHMLGLDPETNFGVLENVKAQLKGDSYQALVASGGICAPLTPLYDFFRTAEPQNPVEDALPVAQAPRGGIRYIVSPDYTGAAGAVGSFDNRNPSADKPCLHVVCPTVAEEYVTAVTQCVEFDNLQYRVFPEQVAAFMEDVAVIFAQTKEVKYLDFINTKSTAVSAAQTYGASRSLLYDWTLAAVGYRKRRQMPRNAMLQLLVPDWTLELIRADIANGPSDDGVASFSVTDAQVNAFLRERGLDPVWINDSATSLSAQRMRGAQAAGALNKFPTTVVAYLYAPGTFVRLDGGTLDVGLVRDSTLNKQNNLQLFMEEWLGIAMLGNESIRMTSTVCPNGSAAALTTAFACP